MSDKMESKSQIEAVVNQVSQIVSKMAGIQLGARQAPMVESRLRNRMLRLGKETFSDYLKYLNANMDKESQALLSLLTTHHTFFFREFNHFEYLLNNGLPSLIEAARTRGDRKIRIWSAASSRGQEAYSLAMFMRFHLATSAPDVDFEIWGTDVDPESVEFAQNAVYKDEELKQAPAMYIEDNWIKGKDDAAGFSRAKDQIKSKCRFQPANLLDCGSFLNGKTFDVIFCRNVFIYFDAKQIEKCMRDLMKHLTPQGFFFLGVSESLNGLNLPVKSSGPSIYRHSALADPKDKKITAVEIPAEPAVRKVLCVDDSSTILALLKKILTAESGFEVVATAQNGREALDILKTKKVDIITLDLHMPEMDGLGFLKNHQNKDIPVVIVSAINRDDMSIAQKALSMGASDYVEKPSLENISQASNQICSKLKTVLAIHQRRQAKPASTSKPVSSAKPATSLTKPAATAAKTTFSKTTTPVAKPAGTTKPVALTAKPSAPVVKATVSTKPVPATAKTSVLAKAPTKPVGVKPPVESKSVATAGSSAISAIFSKDKKPVPLAVNPEKPALGTAKPSLVAKPASATKPALAAKPLATAKPALATKPPVATKPTVATKPSLAAKVAKPLATPEKAAKPASFLKAKTPSTFVKEGKTPLAKAPAPAPLKLVKDKPEKTKPKPKVETQAKSKKKRVLIVDDSLTIRQLLEKIISQDPELEVVAKAERPSEVENLIREHSPDLITLDIHMPEKDGVTLLREIWPKYKIPTVMISSISKEEGPQVLQALQIGAVDYIQKPEMSALAEAAPMIREKLKTAANTSRTRIRTAGKKVPAFSAEAMKTLLLIGASTGGTEAIRVVLETLPAKIPPILIVQHIPAGFSTAFARLLDEVMPFEVREAQDGDEVKPNRVLIAPGGRQMAVKQTKDNKMFVEINDDAPVNRHKPSVDYLFNNVARLGVKKAVAVVMTGMGADGARGLKALRNNGVRTITQDQDTCVVYGMPREAVALGASEAEKPLSLIGETLAALAEEIVQDKKKSA